MEVSPSESGVYVSSPSLAPPPAPMPSANAPPPFLVKTYEMVDDPSTNNIVSWSSTNNSFVVWDPPEFGRNLLPKYFKHNNFSSFVRQLNTYGFRKVDPDRWEFANEGFLRGQKHLLKSISRRKPTHGGHVQQQPQQVHGQSTSVGACVEVGKFGLEEEVERLRRDKNVLMQELVRLRQQQQSTDSQLQTMVQRIQGMEQRQQQMMSFLAKAVNSPGFLAQFVQQQNDSNRRITEGNKKRRLKSDDNVAAVANDGQIIKYQPMINEAAKTMLKQLMKFDVSPRLDNMINNSSDSFSIKDIVSSSEDMDSGLTLQEVPPCSMPPPASPLFGSSCEIAGGSHTMPPVDYQSPPNMIMPRISSRPVGDVDVDVDVDVLDKEEENGGFLNGKLNFDADDVIDWDTTLLDDMEDLPGSIDPFWEKFLESPSMSIETEGLKSTYDELAKEIGNNGRSEHLEQLTTQMGNLSSEANKKNVK